MEGVVGVGEEVVHDFGDDALGRGRGALFTHEEKTIFGITLAGRAS